MSLLKGGTFVFILAVYVSVAVSQTKDGSCPSTAIITPDGKAQLVDCHGKPVADVPMPHQQSANRMPVHISSEETKVSVPEDSETAKAYYDFLAAHYRFDKYSYEHTQAIFTWQHTSSVIVFWVTIILVISGLVLAALQFRGPNTQTSLKISLKELEINSPIVGLMILAISLGFFFLYLRFVYPIQLIRGVQ